MALLEAATKEFSDFVTQCEQKGLVRAEDLTVLHREDGARVDPATARNEKIARYKREKADKDRERQLMMRCRALRREIGDDDAAEDDGELEEVERDLSKLQVDIGIREAIDQIAMTKQGKHLRTVPVRIVIDLQFRAELEMLRMMTAMGGPSAALASERERIKAEERGKKPSSFTIPKSAASTAMRLDSVTSLQNMPTANRQAQQQAMRQQIYAPQLGWSIGVEEWGEQEMARMAEEQVVASRFSLCVTALV